MTFQKAVAKKLFRNIRLFFMFIRFTLQKWWRVFVFGPSIDILFTGGDCFSAWYGLVSCLLYWWPSGWVGPPPPLTPRP